MLDITDPLIFITGTVLICFLIVGIILLIHGGFFSPIDVVTRCSGIGPIDIAYKFAKGSVEDSGPLFTETHSILPDNRTIGVYYYSMKGDTRKTQKRDMQHIVGVILNDPGKEVSNEQKTQLKGFGYAFASFPAVGNSVQTQFPFRSTLSVIISVHRVYPAITKYMSSKKLCGHPVMEVYDSDKGTIFFIVPLEMQDKFYVPEAKYLLDYKQRGSSDDENSTVSFDDTASFIQGDLDSIEDDSSISQSNEMFIAPDPVVDVVNEVIVDGIAVGPEEKCVTFEKKVTQSDTSEQTDESEETDSSYEKIDPSEATQS